MHKHSQISETKFRGKLLTTFINIIWNSMNSLKQKKKQQQKYIRENILFVA